MADQTYLQHAQPSTFGHYLLSFAFPVLRAGKRLNEALEWTDASPRGSGLRERQPPALGPRERRVAARFRSVAEHTRDAMWQVDGLFDMVYAAAGLMVTQSKLAEDLEIWASQEFDYVTLADGYSRASVLMPQKRNPYALSIIRGTAGTLIGGLSGLLAVAKTPSARSDNLIFAYGEVPKALDLAVRATRLSTGVVRTLEVNAERMRSSLDSGFSQATDLAEYIMQTCGIDYRSAYRVVGHAVREASAAGLRGADIDGAMLDAAAAEITGHPLGLTGRDLSAALDPWQIVASRTLLGGAAPGEVRRMAARGRADRLAGRGRPLARCLLRSRGSPARLATKLPSQEIHRAVGTDDRRCLRNRQAGATARRGVGVVNAGLPLVRRARSPEQGRAGRLGSTGASPAGGDPAVGGRAAAGSSVPSSAVIDAANAEVLPAPGRGRSPQAIAGLGTAAEAVPGARRDRGRCCTAGPAMDYRAGP